LRRYSGALWWFADNVVACILAIASGVLLIFVINGLPALCLSSCVSPLIFAFITGITLHGMISRKPKPKHDELTSE
jgi:hypothetical protein